RFHPRILDISKGYCVVVTDQARRKITFGVEHVEHQVNRLMHYLDFSEIHGKQLQTVNLFVERNTPVVFAEPEEEEAAPIAPAPANSAVSKSKDSKNKAATPSKKAEAISTPLSTPVSTPPKSSTPPRRSNSPADSVKKPFSLNG
ncbi:MAG: hypothetical protein ABIZ56_06250, partial [Chthoniobacteraceae bacterium]